MPIFAHPNIIRWEWETCEDGFLCIFLSTLPPFLFSNKKQSLSRKKGNDVSTASTVRAAVPDAGKVIKISAVLGGTIATANAAVTAKIGTTNMTNGAITIAQSGSAAGDIDTCEPTAANNVSEGDFIAIATNGASTNTHSVHFTIVIRR